jgi:hypothetical protein
MIRTTRAFSIAEGPFDSDADWAIATAAAAPPTSSRSRS